MSLQLRPLAPYDVHTTTDSSPDSSVVKRKRGKGRDYNFVREFDSKEDAKQYVIDQKIWSKNYNTSCEKGDKEHYRCNQVPQKEVPCPSSLYLLYNSDNSKVSVFLSTEEHAGHSGEKRGLTAEQKSAVIKLFEDGVTKPKAILSSLSSRGIAVPSTSKLNNFLLQFKKEKYGPATINVVQLFDWCQKNEAIPIDLDEPFVLKYKINLDPSSKQEELNIFMTTLRLLGMAQKISFVQADSTYKLNWQGYPVMIVGTSDKDRHFHPFGICLSYAEKDSDFEFIFRSIKDGVKNIFNDEFTPTALMADASDAITNGFRAVFGPDFTRLMCFFHVMKNVDVHLRQIRSEDRPEMRTDIETLNVCSSHEEFESASELFIQKWESKQDTKIIEFLNYFRKEWLVKHRMWYEGASIGNPSTNNSLEATNSTLKKEHTLRDRLPVSQFLGLIFEKILPSWSKARDTEKINSKSFAQVPTKSLDIWTKSFQWATSATSVLSDDGTNEHYFLSSSSQATQSEVKISAELIKQYKRTIGCQEGTEFDEYRRARRSLWCVKMDANAWQDASCKCPVFLKQYQCKHSIGLAIRMRLVEPPANAKTIPLGQKRKPGRPKKAKAAPVFQ